MKDKLYAFLPNWIQNILISLFNFFAYKQRYGGNYKMYRINLEENRLLSRTTLVEMQERKYQEFIKKVIASSPFYFNCFKNIKSKENLEMIHYLPVTGKELLRKNINDIYTLDKKYGIVSKTGGTTGKSLEVIFTPDNMQERFAMLDDFRSRFGYRLGKKTAWFSGKNLLTKKDIQKNRFWKMDYLYKVRYYSTFHIKTDYLKYYVEDLMKFHPEYMVGFPSTMLEIAKYGLKHGFDFPANKVKAIFPTAETITDEMRLYIESFFKTKMYNQYASSEGAPFIFECVNGKLHMELQSGVFEVLDEDDQPAKAGRLVVTSFTTEGTPLIRYDIGDSIELSDEVCTCGNNNPLVNEILGRVDDYIYSPENGKINLGNVSNTLKDTTGIVKFQAIQDTLDALQIKLVVDQDEYNQAIERTFIKNWEDRVGQGMKIELTYVQDIPNEASGKYRIIKNNIKHLVENA